MGTSWIVLVCAILIAHLASGNNDWEPDFNDQNNESQEQFEKESNDSDKHNQTETKIENEDLEGHIKNLFDSQEEISEEIDADVTASPFPNQPNPFLNTEQTSENDKYSSTDTEEEKIDLNDRILIPETKCISIESCPFYDNMWIKYLENKSLTYLKRKVYGAHCYLTANEPPKVNCPISEIKEVHKIKEEHEIKDKEHEVKDDHGMKEESESALLLPPKCGETTSSDGKVAGGAAVHRVDVPWMAALGYERSNGSFQLLCGGSLISSWFVLTVAHCQAAELSVVRLGEQNLDDVNKYGKTVDFEISAFVPHEDYDTSSKYNDIALLLLDRKVQFTESIQPICVPWRDNYKSSLFEHHDTNVVGWGETESRVEGEELRRAKVSVWSHAKCQKKYKTRSIITHTQMCANQMGKDSCSGDSGGPLYALLPHSDHNNYNYVIGLVSYGPISCKNNNIPGVYTRVGAFVDWISHNIQIYTPIAPIRSKPSTKMTTPRIETTTMADKDEEDVLLSIDNVVEYLGMVGIKTDQPLINFLHKFKKIIEHERKIKQG